MTLVRLVFSVFSYIAQRGSRTLHVLWIHTLFLEQLLREQCGLHTLDRQSCSRICKRTSGITEGISEGVTVVSGDISVRGGVRGRGWVERQRKIPGDTDKAHASLSWRDDAEPVGLVCRYGIARTDVPGRPRDGDIIYSAPTDSRTGVVVRLHAHTNDLPVVRRSQGTVLADRIIFDKLQSPATLNSSTVCDTRCKIQDTR